MRQLAIVLGLASVTLALPSQTFDTLRSADIVQHFHAESLSPLRLSSDTPFKRHDHHEHTQLDPSRAATMEPMVHPTNATTSKWLNSSTESIAIPSTVSHPPLLHELEESVGEGNVRGGTSARGEGGRGHDHHHSRDPPKLVLNETEILLTHAPDPPSYFDFDATEEGMGSTMMAHIILMSAAFFLFLPLAIFLKAGGSHLSVLPQFGFLALSILGALLGRIHSWGTPDMYSGSSHTLTGWIAIGCVIALNFAEVVKLLAKVQASLSRKVGDRLPARLPQVSDEHEALVGPGEESISPVSSRGNSSTFSDADTIYDDRNEVRRSALLSDTSLWQRCLSHLRDLPERFLIILAYINASNGFVVYYGLCRGNYLNGCLAHGIKGSVFLWYGLLTFARFCGGMSALGWAWNRRPSGQGWSAEFVESFVIFLYGSTNTWLERLGKTGAYSAKDVQHISIAVMFWAAGSLGMLLESRTVRSWLATPAIQASAKDPSQIAQPASSSFSFNPFPALVIGVTGIAMSAHHQTYTFQVEIHTLWGYLLAAFSLCRFLTYFFLYLRPPASILPSRPPTEALASLFLACGGVVFILSTEQITFAAMRHQADDMMAFLNVTFAFVCVVFFWIAVLFGVKGWALQRNPSDTVLRNSSVKSA